MSVHCLPDGRWFVKHRQDGKWKREYYGRGAEGERSATARNLQLGLGAPATSGPSVRELAQRYLQARMGSMAESSRKDTAWKLEGVLLPAFGDLPAAALSPILLDRYVADRIALGRKRTSVHRELSILRAVVRWSVSRRLLASNPMDGYALPTRDDAVLQPPTSAELAAIYQAAAPHLRRAIRLAYFTGMRCGESELLALRWEAVDLVNGSIFVESAKKGGMKSRIVPIASGLDSALREWLADDREQGPLGTVVHYHGKPVSRIKTAWRAALVRAGITRRIRPYDLRHLAASAMLDAGADLKSVSEILGHASPDMTLRTYQHTSTTLRREAIGRLGNPLPTVTRNNNET